MDTVPALALAAVILVLIAISVAYVWYAFTGWTAFSAATGDGPGWTPKNGSDISRLRFRDCMFVVTRGDGKTASLDVSPALNAMALGYKGGSNNPPALTLTRPLNPFSFVIPGFNDPASVPDPTAAPWCSSPPAACSSDAGCAGTGTGACGPRGFCALCPGGAAVTLTGKVRTI